MSEARCSFCGNHTTVEEMSEIGANVCDVCKQNCDEDKAMRFVAPEAPNKVWTLAVPDPANSVQQAIAKTVIEMGRFLLDKNRKYGNSALSPQRVHSKASVNEQLMVRMDDKLSRLLAAEGDDEEDAWKDYIGYGLLEMVRRGMEE